MICSSLRGGFQWRAIVCTAAVAACIDVALTVCDVAIADEPSKTATRTWRYEDLIEQVVAADRRRCFESGRKYYKQVKCLTCHRMNGEGNEFGPDLARLDATWNREKILRHVLSPSAEINKDFQSYVLELDDGKTISGLITAEGPTFIKIVENPLKSSQAERIPLDAIETRQKSRISFMPAGLLDSLAREEVLDLIAYVSSRGDDRHPMFHSSSEN